MLLKKIKLENIRSYINEEIEFPQGSILLSGNIGSGKSTILQAVDFALFGITQELSGSSLLRNGEDRGSVELHFAVEDKNVIIKRNLKRGTSVTQDAGYISINNAHREATATELKQSILTLLNYPEELFTKFLELGEQKDVDVALGIDIRSKILGGDFSNLLQRVRGRVEVLFLEARSDILVRRFSETRRKHPVPFVTSIEEGIEKELRWVMF